jgi:hypothetical protein
MVTCRDCGDVVVAVNRCQLRRCDDGGAYSLAYRCRTCGNCDAVTQLHANEVVELLDAGLTVVAWQLPAEMSEARFNGMAVTHDDLLDFHLLLEGNDWWHALLDQ